jgi:hypothetical protein
VKKLYILALALVLISGILLFVPPSMILAANCSAICDTGEVITVKQASWCSCMENVGCVWRRDGKDHARKFSGAELCINAAGWDDH